MRRMVSEICWLAGILEGEGSFGSYHSLTLRCGMTDEDIINKVSNLLNSTIYSYETKTGTPYFVSQIYGINAYQWMITIYPLMGKRRQERIRQIVKEWLTKWKN